jgi:hypothetical protein
MIKMKIFESIKKVETPPFLFTRIQLQIENDKQNRIPNRLNWAFSISFVLILLLNFVVINNCKIEKNKEADLIDNMHLLTENNIYP